MANAGLGESMSEGFVESAGEEATLLGSSDRLVDRAA
jgi:hypothetical protein